MKAVIICEGEFCEVREFWDNKHLNDFREGFSCAAEHYGAGSFGVYTVNDLSDSVLDPKYAEIIRKYLVNQK